MSAEEQVRLDNFDSIFSLDGKVAVVTGGSRGLGLHAASGSMTLEKADSGYFSNRSPQVAPA
ncbi:hypothetical protein KXW80_005845, partial [Aspergillus fumigatus]